jgi:hypothetical protein
MAPFLIVVLAGIYLKEQMLLEDILARLQRIGATRADWIPKVEKRLATLEARAGVIYHE